LKHDYAAVLSFQRELSALDPGKQGLKPEGPEGRPDLWRLSALDPGKQGLKHSFLGGIPFRHHTFSA